MAEDEPATCSFCLDGLLKQECCALACRHVFHTACFQQWHDKGKAECPMCKKPARADQLRILEFEMAEVHTERSEALQKLRESSEEELDKFRLDAERELAESRRSIQLAGLEMPKMKGAAEEKKKSRQNLTAQTKEVEDLIVQLDEETLTLQEKTAGIQNQMNEEMGRNDRKLPVHQASIGDSDVQLERKKLRNLAVPLRAKQLHSEFVDARRRDMDGQSILREREQEWLRLEAELARLRQAVSRLEVEQQKLRRAETEQVTRPAQAGSGLAGQRDTGMPQSRGSSTMEPPLKQRKLDPGAAPAMPHSPATVAAASGNAMAAKTAKAQSAAGDEGTAAEGALPLVAKQATVRPAAAGAAALGAGSKGASLLARGRPAAATAGDPTATAGGGATAKFGGLFGQKRTVGAGTVAGAPNAAAGGGSGAGGAKYGSLLGKARMGPPAAAPQSAPRTGNTNSLRMRASER
eukprot:TRINITY_DN19032_c0_g1_i1.p1 TRINITY_DN19032_c0_g1~~TRINITY_DN19032_c0_g1_i1.p1  ORF type:complete len:474 (-),score=106.88 TRINITY_DN19032_c0_g1_i1:252-1646(-)